MQQKIWPFFCCLPFFRPVDLGAVRIHQSCEQFGTISIEALALKALTRPKLLAFLPASQSTSRIYSFEACKQPSPFRLWLFQRIHQQLGTGIPCAFGGKQMALDPLVLFTHREGRSTYNCSAWREWHVKSCQIGSQE